ncbi:MAG: hypothetical protein PHN31_02445 [Candidatus Gracilibacteria bacterium]|nr:hypothetical protein [Candidatus Gracilibacteria bacterium]
MKNKLKIIDIISIIISIFIIFFSINYSYSENNNNNGNNGNGNTDSDPQASIGFYKLSGNNLGNIIFIEKDYNGVYKERFINDYVGTDVRVILKCQNSNVCEEDEKHIDFQQNGNGNLSINLKNGTKIEVSFEVRKIDKTSPTGQVSYNPNNLTWTNGYKTATLTGIDGESWLVGNTSPSYTCNTEGGCTGYLILEDIAGNELQKTFSIKNIDKTTPNINIELFNEFDAGNQKVGITCADEGGSGCRENQDKILWLPMGITKNVCVYDNAGNTKCTQIVTAGSTKDYSDDTYDWVNRDRRLYLKCIDDLSGCKQEIVEKYISKNITDTILKIEDNAGNSLTKHFQISKIDKDLPILKINNGNKITTNNSFFAGENDIKLSFSDTLSGINKSTYKWDSSCIETLADGTKTINGTDFLNNSYIGYNISGNHILYICIKDNAGNISEGKENYTIYPNNNITGNTTLLDTNGSKYGNNSDYYTYKITLKDNYGNPIYGKKILNIEQNCNDFLNCKTVKTDMVDQSLGTDALTEYAYVTQKTNNNGELTFRIKASSTGEFYEKFKMKINKWDNNYNDTISSIELYNDISLFTTNSFKKPFIGNFKVSNDNGITWNGTVSFGTAQKYKLEINNLLNLTLPYSISGFNLNTIKAFDENNFSVDFGTGTINRNLEFDAKINTSINGTSANGTIGLKTNPNPIITYNLGGNSIKYYITSDAGIYDTTPISISDNKKFIGVKVIGELQGQGKQVITGQNSNFSDISKQDTRTTIRKNAYKYITNMTSGQILNKIKYIEGDYTISGEINYETLIIKDGNVTINGDLNTNNKNFGIIVLSDGYDVTNGYIGKGNIYITPNVKSINAIIYADGGLISANNSGNPYTIDTPNRTNELQNQLILKGSLFTRNTIGGSIYSGGEYILPGGAKTTDFNLAMIYDLNYVRRGINSCLESSPGICKYTDGAFVIIYNSSVELTPPKLFSK